MKTKIFYLIILLFTSQIAFAHVTLVYPEGGETFKVNERIIIEWNPTVYHGPGTFTLEYSTDGGSTWITIKTDINQSIRSYEWMIPNIQTNIAKVKVIQVNDEYDDITAYSGNIIFTSISSVKDATKNPISFKLNNAYPNPFNNSTVISYQLKSKSFVQLIVYDLNGREVKKIVNQMKPPGKHEVSWEATGLSSGAYILFLNAGDNHAAKKLMLLK